MATTGANDDMVDAWVSNLGPWEAFRLDLPFTNEIEFESATANVSDYDQLHKPAMCIWFFQTIKQEEADRCVKAFTNKIGECHYNFAVLPLSEQTMHGLEEGARDVFLEHRGQISYVITKNHMTLLDATNPHADSLRGDVFDTAFYLRKVLSIVKSYAKFDHKGGQPKATTRGKLRCKLVLPVPVTIAEEPMEQDKA